jgi:hypothetical protein
MEDLNKITSTRVGDSIHFFVNGAEDSGTVVKMNTSFVTVVKDNGVLQDIHINDTFFIKDILVNKTWNDMSMEERTVALHDIHAYSPRFLAKTWQQLPKELKDVMLEKGKNGALPNPKGKPVGQSHYGQSSQARGLHEELDRGERGNNYESGENPAWGVGTHHEQTLDTIGNPSARVTESIRHGLDEDKRTPKGGTAPKLKPKVASNVEDSHLGSAGRASHVIETNMDIDAPKDYEGQTEDVKVEQFKHESLKPSTKTMQEQIWEEWLDKGEGMGDGGAPAQTSMTTGTTGVYNAVYGKDGRIIGQGEDKDEEEDDKKEDKKEEKKEDKKEDKKEEKKE